jgi:hypothetical protein
MRCKHRLPFEALRAPQLRTGVNTISVHWIVQADHLHTVAREDIPQIQPLCSFLFAAYNCDAGKQFAGDE